MGKALNHPINTAEVEQRMVLSPVQSRAARWLHPHHAGLQVTRSKKLQSLYPDGKTHSDVLTTAWSLTTQDQQILGFHLQKKPLCYAAVRSHIQN